MTKSEALVGTRVASTCHLALIPVGTQGVIDEDYGSGIMVAWDQDSNPLPHGYREHVKSAKMSPWVRDGFDKEKELGLLTVVHRPLRRNIIV